MASLKMRPFQAIALLAVAGCDPNFSRGAATPAVSSGGAAPEAPPPTATPAAGDAPPAELRGLVDAHNRRRADHCAPPLAWSRELASVAQRYADHLRDAGCNLQHSGGPYGENLYGASPAGGTAADAVVDAWYGEVSAYRFQRQGFSMQTGHFTQVVWKGTARLGCGVARCADSEVWVCNYAPPGNVEGQYEQNVSPTGCR